MTAAYEIVRYRPDLREGVLRLQTHLWSPDRSLNESNMAWMYEHNPYRQEPLIFLALCAGEVVGMRAFLTTRWQAGSPAEAFEALYATDFVIAPEHRDRGLVSRIMQAAFRELAAEPYEYAVNLSAGGVTFLASLASGWRSAGPLETVARGSVRASLLRRAHWRLRGWPFVGERAARLATRMAGGLAPFAQLDRAAARRGGRLGPRVSWGRQPRGEEMAGLVSRLPYDGGIRHVRDEAFFAWRYRFPLRDYRFLFLDGDGLEGYLALQTRTWRGPVGRVHVVDWEARDEAGLAELLGAAIEYGGFLELAAWSVAIPPAGRFLLAQRGFEPVDRDRTARGLPCVLVRPIREAAPPDKWTVAGRHLLDPADWDLRMIYSLHG